MLSDAELLKRTSALVLVEHGAVADVVEHLAEIDRRRLYLEHAYPSLYAFASNTSDTVKTRRSKGSEWHGLLSNSLECSTSCAAARFSSRPS
jgi:hypothetical protein